MEETWQNLILDDIDRYYRLAYCYVKNQQDAGDIVQESLYKALKSGETLRDNKAVRTWFYRIVVNTALDFIKKRNRTTYQDDEQWAAIPDEEMPLHLDLKEAIAALPPAHKTIIILRYFEGLKISEVAHILQENENTVKTRLYAALKKLRIKLEEEI